MFVFREIKKKHFGSIFLPSSDSYWQKSRPNGFNFNDCTEDTQTNSQPSVWRNNNLYSSSVSNHLLRWVTVQSFDCIQWTSVYSPYMLLDPGCLTLVDLVFIGYLWVRYSTMLWKNRRRISSPMSKLHLRRQPWTRHLGSLQTQSPPKRLNSKWQIQPHGGLWNGTKSWWDRGRLALAASVSGCDATVSGRNWSGNRTDSVQKLYGIGPAAVWLRSG